MAAFEQMMSGLVKQLHVHLQMLYAFLCSRTVSLTFFFALAVRNMKAILAAVVYALAGANLTIFWHLARKLFFDFKVLQSFFKSTQLWNDTQGVNYNPKMLV